MNPYDEINNYTVSKKSDDDGKIKFTIRYDRDLFTQIERIANVYHKSISEIIQMTIKLGLPKMEPDENLKKMLQISLEIDQICSEIDLFLDNFGRNSTKMRSFLYRFSDHLSTRSKKNLSVNIISIYNKISNALFRIEEADEALYLEIKPVWDNIQKNKNLRALVKDNKENSDM